MAISNRFAANRHTVFTVILFWLVFLGIFMGITMLASSLLPVSKKWGGLRHGITGCCVALAVLWIFLRHEKKSFRDIEMFWSAGTIPRFFAGLLIGAFIFGLMISGLYVFAGLSFARTSAGVGPSLLYLLAFIPLAWMEEAAFRSYTMLKLNSVLGIWKTQSIVAIAFALYHLANGWSVYIAFAGPFVWSFVFGLAALWSKGIALPTGLHAAINILQTITDLKGRGGGLWKPVFKEPVTPALLARTEHTGLIMQILLLVCALLAIAYYQYGYRYKTPTKR